MFTAFLVMLAILQKIQKHFLRQWRHIVAIFRMRGIDYPVASGLFIKNSALYRIKIWPLSLTSSFAVFPSILLSVQVHCWLSPITIRKKHISTKQSKTKRLFYHVSGSRAANHDMLIAASKCTTRQSRHIPKHKYVGKSATKRRQVE